MPGQVVDYLPERQLEEVRNLGGVCGILCAGQVDGELQRAAGGV